MKPKVNYVITTWSGDRRLPNLKYLKDHLLNLLTLKHNLSQITIVKPIVYGCDMSYYDFESLLTKFNCPVEILEKYDNTGQSYGQFFYAYEKYKDEFDYYIFVEDDYMVDIHHFDKILVDEYNEQQVDGFLCSYSGENPDYPRGGCSVSNGIISSNYMSKVYDYFPEPIKKINGELGFMCHINFAKMIRDCGFEFKDFAHKYRVPYFGTNIVEYGKPDTSESIFIPHQIIDLNINFREMSSNDLPRFLDIRNETKDFLHNNTNFTLEQASEWFINNKPKFYIIELGDNIIGYFRTSNWGNQYLYIGCDIHKDFRGFGLGYISYLKFINKIFTEFDIDTIKLEVLSTNTRAKNLYDKLGFKTIGVSEEKINRNGLEIDSIIMELKKDDGK